MSALPQGFLCMSTSGKISSSRSFLSRLNVHFPWLKLYFVLFVGMVAILDLLDLTISRAHDPQSKISIAPMAYHVQITRRDITGKKLIALTFDDGPSATTTPTLLNTLKSRDVPVTFFMLGNMARNNPDIVKRAIEEGHEVASHTMYHQNLVRISSDAARSDIDEAKSVFEGILDGGISFTRPPYGYYNSAISESVGTPIILWSVDTLDWQSRNPDMIVSTALDQAHDGAIVLMHDIYDTSVAAVPQLIDRMRENGYEFVTIPELVKERGVSLENGVAYYNFRP